MGTIEYYLKQQTNSFDSLLNEFDHEKPLYPYMILITRDNDSLVNDSPMLWYWEKNNGFFLKQDRIIPNFEVSESVIPQLYIKSATRYYNVYETEHNSRLTYTFYTKEACHKIFSFFDEEGEDTHGIEPFVYKPSVLEDPNNPPDWMKEKMITEEDIVGMITIQVAPISSGAKTQAVFILLMKRPIADQRPHIFDIYDDFDFQKIFLKSKYLNTYSTKILVWSFIHDLKKKSDIEELQIMNDENNTKLFEDYIRSHYDSFTEEKKNECVIVMPDVYDKYIPSQRIYQRLLSDTIMNLATIIKKDGIGGMYAIASIVTDENVCNLMMTVAKKMLNNKSLIITLQQEYWFPFITVLSFLNIMYNHNPKLKIPTGFWLYYYLYKYRTQCDQEDIPMIDTITAFTLMNNGSSFMKLIEANKKSELTAKFTNKRTGKEVSMVCSWVTVSNEWALYELIYYFSNGCNGYWDGLTSRQKDLWPKRWNDEIGYKEILDYVEKTVHHGFMGIEYEREFYAKKLYEAIESEQLKGNHFMLEYS